MSGEILGPPNYHGYQEALRRVHTERFAPMPFEAFKARNPSDLALLVTEPAELPTATL